MSRSRKNILLGIGLILFYCSHLSASEYRLPSGEVLQDPTRPQQLQTSGSSAGPEEAASFTLNYILAKGRERRAMVNGKKVVVGDEVSGATVKRIEGDRVVISYQGKLKELRLNEVTGIRRN